MNVAPIHHHHRPSDHRPVSLRLVGLAAAVLALLACLALLAACGGDGDGGTTSSPAVLARVDGEPVTQADVDQVLAERRLAGQAVDTKKAAKAALDEAIERVLVTREAERLGLSVGDADIRARIGEVRDRLGGADLLAAMLESVKMTQQQLRDGSSYGLLRDRLRDAKFPDVAAGDAAVRSFYERHRDEVFTEPAAVRLGSIAFRGINAANGVHEKLVKGAAFDEMARMYSVDPATKQSGGMLGWVRADSLPGPLAEAVARLEPGQLSDVVEGPGGWYVLKLYDRRAEQVTPFAKVEAALRKELDQRARLKELERWLERARGRAEVQLLEG